MLKIDKILVPLDFIDLPLHLVHQATALARHFHSEIVLLHVVTPLSYPAGVFEDRQERIAHDLLAEIVTRAKKKLDNSLGPELQGLPIKRLLLKGDPAQEIVQAAHDEKAGLVVIATHGRGAVGRFLLGSVTAKILHNCGCPVWTAAHPESGTTDKFQIRNVLCAIDFGPHSTHTANWAAQLAAEFGARLTLTHVTPAVEMYGPGGGYINRGWKDALFSSASEKIRKVQQNLGIESGVIITSGDVPKALNQLAKQASADVMVVGCRPSDGRLRANGYAIISESPVAVVNV